MKQIMFFLLLFACGAALADANAPDSLDRLQAQLAGVREEQQSAYQNYQMLKERRLHEVQAGSPPMMQQPYGTGLDTPPPDYVDVLRIQQAREERIQQYTSDLRRLSARFLELEDQKRALLRRIEELQRQPAQ